MAEVPVTLTGVIADLYGRTIMGPVKFLGTMVRSDVSVGGGPIFPPVEGGSPPGQPPHPAHPIELPHPEHPIVLPDPPIDKPPDFPPTNPENPQWVWGYDPRAAQWVIVFVPEAGVDPSPKFGR